MERRDCDEEKMEFGWAEEEMEEGGGDGGSEDGRGDNWIWIGWDVFEILVEVCVRICYDLEIGFLFYSKYF